MCRPSPQIWRPPSPARCVKSKGKVGQSSRAAIAGIVKSAFFEVGLAAIIRAL
jgi:hypothetical protein